MAPLAHVLNPEPLESRIENGISTHFYHGTVSPDWVVGFIPNGGYVLGLLVEACIRCQKTTNHRDPIHVTAHFMQPTATSEYRVEIKVIRIGSRFSNLLANLIQDGETKVITHMIFGTLPPFDTPPSAKSYEDIPPTHPLFKPIPLPTHPHTSPPGEMHPKYGRFRQNVQLAQDPAITKRNNEKLVSAPGTHEGGLESGAWWQLAGEKEELGLSMIPFFADVFDNTPTLLARAHGEGTPMKWYPTMVMTIEFKRQLPKTGTPKVSHRTLGVYAKGAFLEHGRHDIYGEIWSAPGDIGETSDRDPDDESWKQDMRCVAVTSQMALSASIEVNRSKGVGKDKAKL
ncbi:hypothetical protein BDV93DRAFT_529369 [Ceratobasidium sp. AG-I]|nr:hypothetical protein BDV93DRAFT_529369 [Ceratobasidium sp. AG-I]